MGAGASDCRHELGGACHRKPACCDAGTGKTRLNSAGAGIDLVLELGGSHGIWAIEIKKSTAPKLERGFHLAVEDIQPNRVFVVYTGQERYPKSADIEVLCLREMAQELEVLE